MKHAKLFLILFTATLSLMAVANPPPPGAPPPPPGAPLPPPPPGANEGNGESHVEEAKEKVKTEIANAKEEDSDGGESITAAEKKTIQKARGMVRKAHRQERHHYGHGH